MKADLIKYLRKINKKALSSGQAPGAVYLSRSLHHPRDVEGYRS